MREDQLFGLIASSALLIWLLGRNAAPGQLWRRWAELVALAMVGLAILYALLRAIIHFLG